MIFNSSVSFSFFVHMKYIKLSYHSQVLSIIFSWLTNWLTDVFKNRVVWKNIV